MRFSGPSIPRFFFGLFVSQRDHRIDLRCLSRSRKGSREPQRRSRRRVRYYGLAGKGRDFYDRTEDGVSYAASYDGWQRTVEWLNARVAPMLTPLANSREAIVCLVA